MACPIP